MGWKTHCTAAVSWMTHCTAAVSRMTCCAAVWTTHCTVAMSLTTHSTEDAAWLIHYTGILFTGAQLILCTPMHCWTDVLTWPILSTQIHCTGDLPWTQIHCTGDLPWTQIHCTGDPPWMIHCGVCLLGICLYAILCWPAGLPT